jgi:hypothetical protein
MGRSHPADGDVVRTNPWQLEIFVQVVEIHYRNLHPTKKTRHGGISGSAENSVPMAGGKPGWRKSA